MPSANNVVRTCDVILQRHFCNIILIHRIILIFRFGQNHRHRPHSCPCRQQSSTFRNFSRSLHNTWYCTKFTEYNYNNSTLFNSEILIQNSCDKNSCQSVLPTSQSFLTIYGLLPARLSAVDTFIKSLR